LIVTAHFESSQVSNYKFNARTASLPNLDRCCHLTKIFHISSPVLVVGEGGRGIERWAEEERKELKKGGRNEKGGIRREERGGRKKRGRNEEEGRRRKERGRRKKGVGRRR
jgi:hypothetical protein